MTSRDVPTDFDHLLHILVDKVRWFTEDAVRQAHAVIDARTSSPAPTLQVVPDPEPTPDSEPTPEPGTHPSTGRVQRPRKAPAKRPARDA